MNIKLISTQPDKYNTQNINTMSVADKRSIASKCTACIVEDFKRRIDNYKDDCFTEINDHYLDAMARDGVAFAEDVKSHLDLLMENIAPATEPCSCNLKTEKAGDEPTSKAGSSETEIPVEKDPAAAKHGGSRRRRHKRGVKSGESV